MKIAFVSRWDVNDVHAWSGTPYFMAKALSTHGFDVEHIHVQPPPIELGHKLARRFMKLVGKHYDYERNPSVAKAYAKQIEQELEGRDFDVIISPSTIPIAHLKVGTPVVFWADATFASMVNFYPGRWSSLSRLTLSQGHQLERHAIQNAALALYSSEWAATSACSDYDGSRSKVGVIPFGANLETSPSTEVINQSIATKLNAPCRLLFIGVDWERKGGQIVVQTAAVLRQRGIDAFVDVVGCEPTCETPHFVNRHGFISKSTPEGRTRLEALMLNAHFLFVPSLAECFGLVYAEAAAYGVPSIAHAVGGVPTAIVNGETGHALPLGSSPTEFADAICKEMASPEAYQAAALRAQKDFSIRLNWEAAAAQLGLRLDQLLKDRATCTAEGNVKRT